MCDFQALGKNKISIFCLMENIVTSFDEIFTSWLDGVCCMSECAQLKPIDVLHLSYERECSI